MTHRLFIATLLVLLMASATIADATEVANKEADLSSHMELTVKQQKEVAMLTQAYTEKTRPIREELWAKKTMLRALTTNPNAEVKDIQTIVNAMKELRATLHAERVVFEEGMMKKYGFIPTKCWIDKNDAFHPAASETDSATEDTQATETSTSNPKSFFQKLFN
ncbi:MAG: hypothetical protein MI749_02060 [Desulfovibrionales bacterium]|nr:hypothetical protein [Desulfovibrionales bacterium]